MKQNKIAVFAGGCFWCTEAIFLNLRGVVAVRPGYAGGHIDHPTYEQVVMGRTGHAEAIEIAYDPGQISYQDLLEVFFATHDPTTLNRQGNDVGEEYRSIIFYKDSEQKQQALDFIKKLEADRVYNQPIVTEVKPFDKFFGAEDYHKNYYERNKDKPYCQLVINPKLAKLRENFAHKLKT